MEANTNIYPSALATFEEVSASPELFMETLEKLHKSIGTKFICRGISQLFSILSNYRARVEKLVVFCQCPFKGYHGRVVDVNGQSVRVELESQMKVVTVNHNMISDTVSVATPFCETPRYGIGSEMPMHPSRTPMHPYMTPMREGGGQLLLSKELMCRTKENE
ncbi:hypothetical protein MRB53_026232 [Persea americana]|uniref:Uncharacterized protein n=1 Tax=Persea americana TaxID=3435 RepID=A0ACC2LHJ7_PERAE|nr:hypothetical protein MRB53_026232 [Persea americana]